MSDMTVAKTILEQLGGRRFIAMTGARDFSGSQVALTFKLPGGGGYTKACINAVRVTLEPSDTYRVEFLRVRRLEVKTVAEHTDIYAEDLCPLFERETGLKTSLGTMGGVCA